MNITLIRYRKKHDWIDGRLQSDIGYLADTVENLEAALPVGKYIIQVVKCKQHARKMPIVAVKPLACEHCSKLDFVCNNTSMPCYCPQICPGNGMHNRKDGAIIVGKYNCSGSLIHPKDTFSRIYEILRKTSERGNEITLTIKETF